MTSALIGLLCVFFLVDTTHGKYRRYFYDPFSDWDQEYYDSSLDDLRLAAPPPPIPPKAPSLLADSGFSLHPFPLQIPFLPYNPGPTFPRVPSSGLPIQYPILSPGALNGYPENNLLYPQNQGLSSNILPFGYASGYQPAGIIGGNYAYNYQIPQQIYGNNVRLLGLQSDIYGNRFPQVPPVGNYGNPWLQPVSAFPNYGPQSLGPLILQNSQIDQPGLSSFTGSLGFLPSSRPPLRTLVPFSNYDNRGFQPIYPRPREVAPTYAVHNQPLPAPDYQVPSRESDIYVDIPVEKDRPCRPYNAGPSVFGVCRNSFDIIKSRACRNMNVESRSSECGISHWCCYWKPPINHIFPRLTPLSLESDADKVASNNPDVNRYESDYFRLGSRNSLSVDNKKTLITPDQVDLHITLPLKPEATAADRQLEARLVPRTMSDPSTEKNIISNDQEQSCGRMGGYFADGEQRSSRILMDNEVTDGELCWQVAIFLNEEYICGGALVSSSDVITTANCLQRFANKNLEELSVVIGATNIATAQNPGPCTQIVAVRQINLHALFNTKTMANDIAVVKLKRPVKNGNCSCMICLPDFRTSPLQIDSTCVIAGYELASSTQPMTGGRLKSSPVQIINSTSGPVNCQLLLDNYSGTPKGYQLGSSMFCSISKDKNYAKESTGKGDACMKDTGSPLICALDSERNRWTISGIVTYGMGCGKTKESLRMPTVYTNVRKQIDWIKNNLH